MARLTLMLMATVVSSCGASPALVDGGSGSMGGGGGSGSMGGGGGGGLTEAERVSIFCTKTLLAHCSQWFSSQTQCVDTMARTQASLCQTKWEAETDCLQITQTSDWVCSALGEPSIANTACRDQYGFGSYCRLAVAKPECYLAACQYAADCPSDYSCNDKTKHCFKLAASCGGLPCTFDSDCPSRFRCNNALEQCVRL